MQITEGYTVTPDMKLEFRFSLLYYSKIATSWRFFYQLNRDGHC